MQADLLAGLSVGVMTVPQSLSYARIAGLPSEYGLYGAFAPVFAYALFGSSRQLVRHITEPCRPPTATVNCTIGDLSARGCVMGKPISSPQASVGQPISPCLTAGGGPVGDHLAAAIQWTGEPNSRRKRQHRPQRPGQPTGAA